MLGGTLCLGLYAQSCVDAGLLLVTCPSPQKASVCGPGIHPDSSHTTFPAGVLPSALYLLWLLLLTRVYLVSTLLLVSDCLQVVSGVYGVSLVDIGPWDQHLSSACF